MRLHYFDQNQADADDMNLGMAKMQGYVPKTCLLSGHVVLDEISKGEDPCGVCSGPRDRCFGRPKKVDDIV